MEGKKINECFEIINKSKKLLLIRIPIFEYFIKDTNTLTLNNENQLYQDPFLVSLIEHGKETFHFTIETFCEIIVFYIDFFYKNTVCENSNESDAFKYLIEYFSLEETIMTMRLYRANYKKLSSLLENFISKKIFSLIRKWFYYSIGVLYIPINKKKSYKKIKHLLRKRCIRDYVGNILHIQSYNGYHAAYELFLNDKGMPIFCICCYRQVRTNDYKKTLINFIPIKIRKKLDDKNQSYLNIQFTALTRTAFLCISCYSFYPIFIVVNTIKKFTLFTNNYIEIKKWNCDEFYHYEKKNYIKLITCFLIKINKKRKKKLLKIGMREIISFFDKPTPQNGINYLISKFYQTYELDSKN